MGIFAFLSRLPRSKVHAITLPAFGGHFEHFKLFDKSSFAVQSGEKSLVQFGRPSA